MSDQTKEPEADVVDFNGKIEALENKITEFLKSFEAKKDVDEVKKDVDEPKSRTESQRLKLEEDRKALEATGKLKEAISYVANISKFITDNSVLLPDVITDKDFTSYYKGMDEVEAETLIKLDIITHFFNVAENRNYTLAKNTTKVDEWLGLTEEQRKEQVDSFYNVFSEMLDIKAKLKLNDKVKGFDSGVTNSSNNVFIQKIKTAK